MVHPYHWYSCTIGTPVPISIDYYTYLNMRIRLYNGWLLLPVECLLGIVYYRQQKDGLLSIYCNITSNKTGSTDLYCIVYKGWVEKNPPFWKNCHGSGGRTVCPRRLSFSPFVVLMSKTNGEKDSLLGQTVLPPELREILAGLFFFVSPFRSWRMEISQADIELYSSHLVWYRHKFAFEVHKSLKVTRGNRHLSQEIFIRPVC